MTRPTSRVLTVLDILQSGGVRTVTQLAERLGVNERTVRRYIAHLIDLEVPIESVRGRYGGYRLAPGRRLPPLMLTDDEALATVLGLVAGRRAGLSASIPNDADAAAAKIRRVLPRALGRRLEALLETTTFTTPTVTPASPETGVLLALAEAARERHAVSISYTNRSGTSSRRIIRPYGLVAHSGRWYVAAADSVSDETRTFRLDRIADPRLLPATFEAPPGFDPAEYILSGLAQTPWAHEVSLLIDGTIEEIRRRLPAALAIEHEVHTPQTATAAPRFRVRFRVESLDWVPSVLAALNRPFAIERPDELRTLVRAFAERLEGFAEAPPETTSDDEPLTSQTESRRAGGSAAE